MGLEERRRRLLGFLLLGCALASGVIAQSNPATVSLTPILSKVPSAKPLISEAPSIRPSPSNLSHHVPESSLSESPSLSSRESLALSLTDNSSSVPSKSPNMRSSANYIRPADEISHHNGNFAESSTEHELVPFREECVAHVIHVNRGTGDGRDTVLSCSWRNGLSYPIPSISEDWIDEQMVLGELISTETTMTLPPDAVLNLYTHEIHMTGMPKLWNYGYEEREQRRKLRRLATIGTKTVLVVRVQATDATTTPTATQLGNHVFGDDGNDYNLKFQTEACSHNQLIINKASDRTGSSTSISSGIVTLPVSVATSVGITSFQNAVTEALNAQFSVSAPSDLADHVMYCYPPGVTESAVVAFAIVGGYLSLYNDVACTYPSAQMHEIGHNYNMGHSSDSGDEYGDKSGLMGFSYSYTDIPKMCFNAAKSWQLGWYSSKADSISPSSTNASGDYVASLAGIVDYSTTTNKCLIEIQQSTSTTYYYVSYNRATGINADTVEGADQVLVVSKDTSVETNISMALAALDAGQSYSISSFNGNSEETLTITFTSLVNNEAVVNVALAGAPSVSSNPSIGPSLSSNPSHVPSNTPSIVPSLAPSVSSVPSDLSSMSIAPSQSPSKIPSTSPSRVPSQMPSKSLSPSNGPSVSQYPSLLPSAASSFPSSSSGPTMAPSSSLEPTTSTQPSGERLRPIVEWEFLVVNRFNRGFADVVEIGGGVADDSDSETIVITATNTTSLRVAGQQAGQEAVLAMTGQSTIELNDWVDVTNYKKVQMLFWFYARRNQANVESDRFVVEYLNRTTNGDEGTWVTLRTYQRGRGRFRRNNQWYLGRVIISTQDLEAVLFRFQSFFPTSSKMVLLDKFGILGFAKEGVTTMSGTVSDESQRRGGPNRSDSIRGKTTNMTVDEGWLSQPLI